MYKNITRLIDCGDLRRCAAGIKADARPPPAAASFVMSTALHNGQQLFCNRYFTAAKSLINVAGTRYTLYNTRLMYLRREQSALACTRAAAVS
ncbi:hypothetical protein EVAR_80405_1 [Eumeta japonica]|uniref:Uncharacterized protein n=1 Tax=Eumeta variegata TaxID=151549 RepID=A0A4C1VIA8_EUMVA|nr:hypothetical protein EVAR_80405_1 [Eumeta japonica]